MRGFRDAVRLLTERLSPARPGQRPEPLERGRKTQRRSPVATYLLHSVVPGKSTRDRPSPAGDCISCRTSILDIFTAQQGCILPFHETENTKRDHKHERPFRQSTETGPNRQIGPCPLPPASQTSASGPATYRPHWTTRTPATTAAPETSDESEAIAARQAEAVARDAALDR